MDSHNTRYTLLLVSSILLLMLSSSLTTSDDSKDKEECTESLVGLATCLPYVGGNAKAPTPDCCSGLKQVLKTNKKCLCVVVKDRNDPDLSLNINVTLALSLPQVCNAPANISQCPELLNLPPDSPDAQVFYQFGRKTANNTASSPVAGGPIASVGANTTPGSNGEQKSGCPYNRKKWLGWEIIGGIVLLWAINSNNYLFM